MGRDFSSTPDAVELCQTAARNRAFGGFVTPGAAVNVNVAAVLATVNGMDVESAGSTNLAVTAGTGAGETVRNAIVISNTGTISAVAGDSATTGDQVAPTIDETTQCLLAHVDVDNGAVGVAQGDIDNTVRRWL